MRSVLTEDLPSIGWVWQALQARCQCCRKAGEEASPDHVDSRDRSTAPLPGSGRPVLAERSELELVCRGARVLVGQEQGGIGDPTGGGQRLRGDPGGGGTAGGWGARA